ncbi:hypothetical protein PN415_18365 [Halorubrum ezzemoulense]|uniref:hypothetical protein n=1 Tax=Halorubrum ezzemoulense TaxID=337243 RepID=UPI00232B873E|nr:hypothetical protein [Halorubrum ezzemoulense]MDB9281786.1 hypothetical protein [Halorubrum ezzemoulense]
MTEPSALVGPHAPDWGEREQTGSASRLSKTNRADEQNGRETASAPPSRFRPLTERDGVTLRLEARDWGALDGDRADSWATTTDRWRDYVRDKEDVETVFEDVSGNRAQGSKPHRFDPEYADKQYAKLKDLERGISEEYGKRLHTAMLTFTASSTDADGDPLPPVDHFDGLLSSWDAIRRALDRALDGRRYERLAILEPHQSGYLHVHMAVFVDGRVRSSRFDPVIEAHVRNCDLAEWDAHDLDADSTISVRHAGADRDAQDSGDEALDELAIYLAEYLGTYGDDPLDQPEHVQAANALLWATGRQRWRPSNGAQSYMATEPREPDSEWSVVGVEVDGEFRPADPENGGVDRFTTGTDPPP